MARTSAAQRVEMVGKLRADMRSCLISNSSVEWCLTHAKGQVLSFMGDFFAMEAGRRHDARIANIVRSAGFPTLKDIGDYDMSELRLPAPMICLGMLACRKGYKVRFLTLAQLAVKLRQAAQEERLENLLLTLRGLDLLIIDEWGYTQVDSESAGYIYRVIADSYERKSLIITTNLPFSEWGRLFADEQLAAAIIDRIVHYGHLVDTGKKDWRLSNSTMNGRQLVNALKEVR